MNIVIIENQFTQTVEAVSKVATWKKVYKDGYDKNNEKISIHYFQSKSGLVYDVKVKQGWSVK